jgi:hypothetical protein
MQSNEKIHPRDILFQFHGMKYEHGSLKGVHLGYIHSKHNVLLQKEIFPLFIP